MTRYRVIISDAAFGDKWTDFVLMAETPEDAVTMAKFRLWGKGSIPDLLTVVSVTEIPA